MAKNYYDTLGIDKNASKDEIKKAYKKLARKYHPDISKEEGAEAKFKEVNEAAEVLLDDQKKQRYDTYGSAEGPSGFGGGGGYSSGGFNPGDFGINIDDIFEQFGFGGGGFGSSRGGFSSGKDTRVSAQVEVSLDDVYFGCEKDVKVTRDVMCDTCDGKGAKDSSDVKTCSTCHGSGVVTEIQRSILGAIRTQRPCPSCHGRGKTINNPCSACSGEGSVRKTESMSLKIPKGIENGVTLRVPGKGSYDMDTSSYGDLYVRVFLKENKTYDVDGADLYMKLDINFIQAILGDEVEFKHFGKILSLKVPQGTQGNTVLRLKGKGLPYFNSNNTGDLYVKIDVEIPKKTTNKQKEILLDYAKTLKDKSFLDRLKGIFK